MWPFLLETVLSLGTKGHRLRLLTIGLTSLRRFGFRLSLHFIISYDRCNCIAAKITSCSYRSEVIRRFSYPFATSPAPICHPHTYDLSSNTNAELIDCVRRGEISNLQNIVIVPYNLDGRTVHCLLVLIRHIEMSRCM